MNVAKLIAEVKEYPYLYDWSLSDHYDKELCNRAWDTIANNVYKCQWNKSNAEKARKGDYILTVF